VHLASAGFITFTYGGRANKLYVPNTYNPNIKYPLFVMLHGCTQDPDQFARGSKMNTLAEQKGFFVLYPLQPSSANLNKCWNWFEPAHQGRGSGEPAFIAGATAEVKNQYAIEDTKVFAAGLSAGAAMTVIMGATYPDVFSGLGVAAGLEFVAAKNTLDAFTAMREGGPPARSQAALAWASMKDNFKAPLKVLVVQGTADWTVYPINGQQVTDQWVFTNDFALGGTRIPPEPSKITNGQVTGGRQYVDQEYADTVTKIVYGRYIAVKDMGHAWSGGDITGSFTDPRGPDMSLMMYSWFVESA